MNKIFVLICCATIPIHLRAQLMNQDSAFVGIASTNAAAMLSKTQGLQSHLYNGVAFYDPPQTDEAEHPFFLSDDWIDGDIVYDAELNKNIPLMYDIMNEQLITEMPNGTRIRLITEKISSFKLNGLEFTRLSAPELAAGFHALLYDGSTKVYARYEKMKQERISDRELTIEYEKKFRYYIFRNGVYYPVKSKNDVLKIFGDQKRELKQFMQREKINFKKNREKSIVKLVAFYDKIQP